MKNITRILALSALLLCGCLTANAQNYGKLLCQDAYHYYVDWGIGPMMQNCEIKIYEKALITTFINEDGSLTTDQRSIHTNILEITEMDRECTGWRTRQSLYKAMNPCKRQVATRQTQNGASQEVSSHIPIPMPPISQAATAVAPPTTRTLRNVT